MDHQSQNNNKTGFENKENAKDFRNNFKCICEITGPLN